jgi:hypothetical protein
MKTTTRPAPDQGSKSVRFVLLQLIKDNRTGIASVQAVVENRSPHVETWTKPLAESISQMETITGNYRSQEKERRQAFHLARVNRERLFHVPPSLGSLVRYLCKTLVRLALTTCNSWQVFAVVESNSLSSSCWANAP